VGCINVDEMKGYETIVHPSFTTTTVSQTNNLNKTSSVKMTIRAFAVETFYLFLSERDCKPKAPESWVFNLKKSVEMS